jgi:hypothetical protein
MADYVDGTAFNNEQGQRARKLFAAVVLAALDDAIADDKKYGNGAEQIARWARTRDHDPGHGLECRQVAACRGAGRAARGGGCGSRRSSRRTCRTTPPSPPTAARSAARRRCRRGRRGARRSDMNPVLLKPESETGAQVIVQGRRWATARGAGYAALKPRACCAGAGQLSRGSGELHDLVLSRARAAPAEINLRAGDIANMGFACAAGVPVMLVGDIDRGGVIAQIVGTHAVLDPRTDRAIGAFSSTSSGAIRGCSTTAMRRSPPDRLARLRRAALVRRWRRGCRPRMRWIWPERRAGLKVVCLGCRASRISTTSTRSRRNRGRAHAGRARGAPCPATRSW